MDVNKENQHQTTNQTKSWANTIIKKKKKYNDVAEYKSWEVLIFSIPAAEC